MALRDIEPDWRIPDGAGRDLGIGIVGCGGIVTGCHLPAYAAAGLRVAAVTDIDPDRARTVAEEHGIEAVTADAAGLVARDDVDIVDIAVPPWAQPEIVALAAGAGKHLLCQKPLALELDVARTIVRTAADAGVVLAVNQQLRWSAGIAASRDLVGRGAIGSPRAARIDVNGPPGYEPWPWLAEAPRLSIQYHGIHYLDALRSILGDPRSVTSVQGRVPEQAPILGETRSVTVVEWEGGTQALLTLNEFDPHGVAAGTFRILGSEGSLDGTIGLLYDPPDTRPDTLELRRSGEEPRPFTFDTRWFPDAFLGPMADLMDAIASGREPITSGRDNLRTVALVLATYRSAAEQRTVDVEELLSA